MIPELALAQVALLTTPTPVELSGEGFPNRICKISFPIKSNDLLVLSNREGHLNFMKLSVRTPNDGTLSTFRTK